MSNFPDTAEEFYRRRDDRTDRCSDNRTYQHVSCAIHIDQEAASTDVGQVILIASANLLSRWCRKITLVMSECDVDPALGFGTVKLGEFMLAQMRDADPFGDFRLSSDTDERASQIVLCIGEDACREARASTVFVNASGWLASISTERPIPVPRSDARNHLGAIAAACLGVAQVFKIATGAPADRHLREGIFDVFALKWLPDPLQMPWPNDLDVGNLLMVGAGSVASSAAYCMRLCGIAGGVAVVDGDHVEIENFNRSPLFGRSTFGLPKADVVAGFLAGSEIEATPFSVWWAEFLRTQGRATLNFDVWLPLANEFDVRRNMQHNVPPLMIHASTTLNWGVNHARHIPGRDDCLIDRFPAEVGKADLACATGEVIVSEEAVDAALPFASLFAGLLIVADLVRIQLADYPQVPNFGLFDFYGPGDRIQLWDRRPEAGCICRDQSLALHKRFNAGTRYWKLFRFSPS